MLPDLTKAVEASHRWRVTPLARRLALIDRLHDCLASKGNALARLMAEEIGKPIRFGAVEVTHCLDMLRAIAAHAKSVEAETLAEWSLRRRPHGIVAIITPWNNPFYIPLGKIVPAVLYGNAVAWKPAPEARACARSLLDSLEEAGWPGALVTPIEGDWREGEALVKHSAVGAVTITGSLAAGQAVQAICADRFVPLQAELGGNNGSIVWPDADLFLAARAIANGAFDMAGQRCTASRRAIVHESCHDEFVRLLIEASTTLKWGDPLSADTDIGPLVSAERRDHVASLVARAIPYCQDVVLPLGETPRANGNTLGAFYPPIILRCEEPASEIVQEETFGPVLVVQSATSFERAMALCNGVRQGLSAAIFATSDTIIERFLDEAEAGILKINRSTAGALVDAPFGGWKASGIGPPEHGRFDIEFFTRPQTVYGA